MKKYYNKQDTCNNNQDVNLEIVEIDARIHSIQLEAIPVPEALSQSEKGKSRGF